MPTRPDDMVAVYRRSTRRKLPARMPRSVVRLNPDLRVVPSDRSKARRLDLADARTPATATATVTVTAPDPVTPPPATGDAPAPDPTPNGPDGSTPDTKE